MVEQDPPAWFITGCSTGFGREPAGWSASKAAVPWSRRVSRERSGAPLQLMMVGGWDLSWKLPMRHKAMRG
jgi:hypothetical protein